MHNLNIERAILATILYSPEEAENILEGLKEEAFYHPAHRSIYQTIEFLAAKNIPIDEDFIRKHYKGGEWDNDVFFEALSTTPLPNCTPYISELKDLSKKRKTTHALREALSQIENGTDDIDSLIAELENNSMDGGFNPITVTQLMQIEFPIAPIFSTKIRWLDDSFNGGLECGRLYAFGGSKDAGKTTLTEQIVNNISIISPVAYFGLEFNPRNYQKKLVRQKGSKYQNDNFYYVSGKETDGEISDICAKIRFLNRKKGVRFFCIDSQMKLWKKQPNMNQEQKVTAIFDELSKIVVKLDICVFMIVQYSKEDARNKSFEIMHSKAAGHIVDAMIDIERLPSGKRKVSIVKNKIAGKYDVSEVGFDTEKLEFEASISGGYEEHIYQADNTYFTHLKV